MIFLSPDNPIGAVVLGIAASALIGLARVFRQPLIRLVRRVALPAPWLRHLLRISADTVYPSWRAGAGYTRQQYSLQWRIAELRKLRRPAIVIAGGVYLDLHFTPVDVSTLDGSEYGNLDTVQVECGGSAFFVSKYLYQHYRQRSHIFSRLGSGDPLSETLRGLLKREGWVAQADLARVAGTQCGVSAHLLKRDGFHTTFTSMGTLSDLRWGPILGQLKRKTRRGGVLYISGYFRTDLCTDLIRTLAQLSPKLLVCVDHGRFRKDEKPKAAAALTGAFAAGLVDVYICTLSEIKELMASTGLDVDLSDPHKALTRCAAARPLPAVTIVRGEDTLPQGAYVVVADRVEFIPAAVVPGASSAVPGRKNAFNAALVYELTRGRPDLELPEAVVDATRRAVQAWAEHP